VDVIDGGVGPHDRGTHAAGADVDDEDAHRFAVPRPSAGASICPMGAALLAALRCSLIDSPCLVPRPAHDLAHRVA
jgi:hypothetical protein